jgi:hypothetical protein
MYNAVGSLREEGGRRHHEGPHRYDMMMQIENKKECEREVTALLLLTVVMMGCTVSTVTAATVYLIDNNDGDKLYALND